MVTTINKGQTSPGKRSENQSPYTSKYSERSDSKSAISVSPRKGMSARRNKEPIDERDKVHVYKIKETNKKYVKQDPKLEMKIEFHRIQQIKDAAKQLKIKAHY